MWNLLIPPLFESSARNLWKHQISLQTFFTPRPWPQNQQTSQRWHPNPSHLKDHEGQVVCCPLDSRNWWIFKTIRDEDIGILVGKYLQSSNNWSHNLKVGEIGNLSRWFLERFWLAPSRSGMDVLSNLSTVDGCHLVGTTVWMPYTAPNGLKATNSIESPISRISVLKRTWNYKFM